MLFKFTPTGSAQADRIAQEHGEYIVRECSQLSQIRERFGVSDYCARRIRVACGLDVKDPAAYYERRKGKGAKAAERRELQTGDGDDSKGVSYEMDTLAGEYVFTFPHSRHTPPKRMSRAAVAQLVMDYSNAGGRMTRSQLATAWAMPRWQAVAILRSLGIVKAAVPFTEEDIQDAVEQGAVADLDARWMAATKQQVEARVERAKDAEMVRDAMRWRESRLYTFEWAKEATESLIPTLAGLLEGPYLQEVAEGSEGVTLVLGVTDLHFGAYAWSEQSGERWNREVCRERLTTAIDSALARLPGNARVDRIVLPIGSDMAHVDNAAGSTTKGTPQDMDGTPEQMVHELWELTYTLVVMLAQIAPVDLWLMEANHDHILGHALFASLSMAFRDSDRVSIKRDSSTPYGPYQIGKYGNTLLGFAHGDGRHNNQDLSAVMAQQGRELWSETEHRIWVTGHRHAHSVQETHGVEVHIMPSLAGTDRYHQKKWPHRQGPRLKALVLHETDGLIASVFGTPGKSSC